MLKTQYIQGGVMQNSPGFWTNVSRVIPIRQV